MSTRSAGLQDFGLLANFLSLARLDGLLFEGQFFERETGKKEFVCMPSVVYVRADVGLLKISTGVNGGKLNFELVPQPVWETFGEDWEEMERAGTVNMAFQFWGEYQNVQCHAFRLGVSGVPQAEGDVVMAEFSFTYHEKILLDPWWPAGIRVISGKSLEAGLAYHAQTIGSVDVVE